MTMTIEQGQKALKLKDTILKMFNDSKYKTVFEEAYFRDEAMRLPLALVDNEMQDEIEQRIINEKIKAIGHLHVFLNSAIALGNQVQASLEAEEREIVDAAKNIEYDEVSGEPIIPEDEV